MYSELKNIILLLTILCFGLISQGQSHPNLVLTHSGVEQIRKIGDQNALFNLSVETATTSIEKAVREGVDVPIPKDMAGGYSHEQHKRNYKYMSMASALYQIKNESRYADFVKNTLLKYCDLFEEINVHPSTKSYAPGKLFWQCLNDANWLVYTAQAYDGIYNYLSKAERKKLEKKVFMPYADFLSIQNPKFFNRIHNHSTWGNAAVGMIGLVMDNDELINRALYGLKIAEGDLSAKDNDGGYIYEKGKAKAGFLAQIDNAFSPDGYYTEGPYYQRYAMTPFMLFAASLANNRPDLKIFEHNDGVLIKAVYALVNQTNQAGEFYPINDCQKGMSIQARSVISALNIAYAETSDPALLSIIKSQESVLLNQYGLKAALDLHDKGFKLIPKSSVELRDGADGTSGALGILRTGGNEDETSVVFKYTGQGLGHGHYDKLGILVYQGANEVLQDYGSARWVNVDQKSGGRYLPENKSWAKQTIAHNTIIADQTSHFNGKYKLANDKHSSRYFFDISDKNFQIASAKDNNAYQDIALHRTVMLLDIEELDRPFIVDLFLANSSNEHVYSLPYQYAEHHIYSNPKLAKKNNPKIMGTAHGYQHLYLEGEAPIVEKNFAYSWTNNNEFYTITGLSEEGDDLQLARIGANDSNFNLRNEAILIHNKAKRKNAVYLSVIEPHGTYSRVTEIPNKPFSAIAKIRTIHSSNDYIIFEITTKDDVNLEVGISLNNNNEKTKHELSANSQTYAWVGTHYYKLTKE